MPLCEVRTEPLVEADTGIMVGGGGGGGGGGPYRVLAHSKTKLKLMMINSPLVFLLDLRILTLNLNCY